MWQSLDVSISLLVMQNRYHVKQHTDSHPLPHTPARIDEPEPRLPLSKRRKYRRQSHLGGGHQPPATSQLRRRRLHQLASLPQRTAVNLKNIPIDMRARPATQIHDGARDVLGPAQPAHRVLARDQVHAPAQLHQPRAHLGREEARRDAVDGDVARPQLERQVAPQVDGRRLAGAVPERGLPAQGADAHAGHRRRDDHPAGVVDAAPPLQQRREQPDGVEHGPHVQVEHLGDGRVRVRVEGLAPRGARVGQQDVDVVRVLLHRVDEVLHAFYPGRVGGHRDGDRARLQAGQGVEGFAGGLAGRGLAGGDEDFGAACLEEAVWAGGRMLAGEGWRDGG